MLFLEDASEAKILVIREFQPGVEELSPGAQRPTQFLHTGVLGKAPWGPTQPQGQSRKKGSILNFLRGNCSTLRLAQPCPHTGSQVWGEPGTRVPLGAHKAAARGRTAPSPGARQVESISLGACLLPRPRSGVPDLAARIRPSAGRPSCRGR